MDDKKTHDVYTDELYVVTRIKWEIDPENDYRYIEEHDVSIAFRRKFDARKFAEANAATIFPMYPFLWYEDSYLGSVFDVSTGSTYGVRYEVEGAIMY